MIDDPTTEAYDPETPKFATKLMDLTKDQFNIDRYQSIYDELMDFQDRYPTRREKEANLLRKIRPSTEKVKALDKLIKKYGYG